MKDKLKQSVRILTSLLLFVCVSVPTGSLSAAVRLPSLISDRMVLQRDTELNIWGWANPGEKVTVRFQGNYYDTEADKAGKWSVLLPPHKHGGPFIMEVNEIIIRDILIGDVWLCSGQSNQETPISRLTDMFPEINVSNNHMIRHYKVPTNRSPESEQEDISQRVPWHSAIASDVMNWTALAYFFAQETYDHTKIPQGMLVSSLGGSNIESWISQEHLKEFPRLLLNKEALNALNFVEKDKGSGKWASLDLNDSDWQNIVVPGRWKENRLNTKGVVWYRKEIEVPSSMDGKHAKLYMGTLVNSDSVFVNGRYVGHTSYEYPPRKYNIPAGILKRGKNVIAVKLTADNGNGGFIPDKPYKIVVDNVEINLIGIWKYKVGKDLNEMVQYSEQLQNRKTVGSSLYNGMIYPIRNYQVKGTIWYQGEANAGRPKEYASLLTSLITNWRELWNQPNMPFLLVQLPNFMKKADEPSESGWAELREAQFKVAQTVPYTTLATTYDVGEWNDIHPLDKKAMAQRLFLGARKLAYGEKLVSSGPLYKNMQINGNKIILTFTETGSGLTSNGKPLKHFAIAGKDRKFVWAEAIIRGNKVVVSSEQVINPVAVRYAWSNNPEDANLRNKEGLLASPFRTDNW